MSQIEAFFAEVSAMIDTGMDRLLPAASSEPRRLHQAVRWSLFGGGKRFRPALVIAVGRTFGAKDEQLIRTAAAIEMIHTYSLIHDDLPAMDNDDLRRGRETCHVKFDEATAILAGDVLQTLAFKTLADDENLTNEMRIGIISEIAAAAGTPNGMVAGQQMDLDAEGEDPPIERIEEIHRSKTGALIRASATAGALIGSASADELQAISSFGSSLGLLFQITDDILDVTQSTEALGKTAGKDITAEKATYPSILGLDEAKRLAHGIHAEAIANLIHLNRPTDLLRQIADTLLSRQS